jgi:hypothetical protein
LTIVTLPPVAVVAVAAGAVVAVGAADDVPPVVVPLVVAHPARITRASSETYSAPRDVRRDTRVHLIIMVRNILVISW